MAPRNSTASLAESSIVSSLRTYLAWSLPNLFDEITIPALGRVRTACGTLRPVRQFEALRLNPFSTAVSSPGQLGTNCLEIECFVPKTGLEEF